MSIYSENFEKLNRLSEKRSDDSWISEQLNNEKSLFVPVLESQLFFNPSNDYNPAYLSLGDVKDKVDLSTSIFLGQCEKISYFAVGILESEKEVLKEYGQFLEVRKALTFLKEFDISVLLHARAMHYWHSRHKFCGTCGSPTINKEAGNLLVCSNENCKESHFPRTDPAIIVLVTNGEKCLLGHNKAWPGNRYSTLAGFVEPGETLEDAVRREVFEESGIKTKNINYVSSQPWPFPSSIMLGFTAEAITENITIDNNEIEHAAWFSREEIKDRLLNNTIKMPMKISIAFKLVSQWFDKGEFGKLSDISGDN